MLCFGIWFYSGWLMTGQNEFRMKKKEDLIESKKSSNRRETIRNYWEKREHCFLNQIRLNNIFARCCREIEGVKFVRWFIHFYFIYFFSLCVYFCSQHFNSTKNTYYYLVEITGDGAQDEWRGTFFGCAYFLIRLNAHDAMSVKTSKIINVKTIEWDSFVLVSSFITSGLMRTIKLYTVFHVILTANALIFGKQYKSNEPSIWIHLVFDSVADEILKMKSAIHGDGRRPWF